MKFPLNMDDSEMGYWLASQDHWMLAISYAINSLIPGRCGFNFNCGILTHLPLEKMDAILAGMSIFKHIFMNKNIRISIKI